MDKRGLGAIAIVVLIVVVIGIVIGISNSVENLKFTGRAGWSLRDKDCYNMDNDGAFCGETICGVCQDDDCVSYFDDEEGNRISQDGNDCVYYGESGTCNDVGTCVVDYEDCTQCGGTCYGECPNENATCTLVDESVPQTFECRCTPDCGFWTVCGSAPNGCGSCGDCPTGEWCDSQGVYAGICSNCGGNGDCEDDVECLNGRCQYPTKSICVGDTDCKPGEVCKDGNCVEAKE